METYYTLLDRVAMYEESKALTQLRSSPDAQDWPRLKAILEGSLRDNHAYGLEFAAQCLYSRVLLNRPQLSEESVGEWEVFLKHMLVLPLKPSVLCYLGLAYTNLIMHHHDFPVQELVKAFVHVPTRLVDLLTLMNEQNADLKVKVPFLKRAGIREACSLSELQLAGVFRCEEPSSMSQAFKLLKAMVLNGACGSLELSQSPVLGTALQVLAHAHEACLIPHFAFSLVQSACELVEACASWCAGKDVTFLKIELAHQAKPKHQRKFAGAYIRVNGAEEEALHACLSTGLVEALCLGFARGGFVFVHPYFG